MSAIKRRRATAGQVFWNKLTKPSQAIWDVGSVRTRVLVKDRVVFDQPSALAVRQDTGEVIAVGQDAYGQIGAGNNVIRVEFPVKRGAVSNEELAVFWLRHIRQELWPNRKLLPFSFSPGGRFLLPPGIGATDRDEWMQVFALAGLHFVQPSQPVTNLPMLINLPESELLWIAVLGGDHSVLVLVQGGKIIKAQPTAWGGVFLSEAVQFWLASKEGLAVSWKTAEDLKVRYGTLLQSTDKKIVVRGKNPTTQLGMSASITQDQLSHALAKESEGFVFQIKQFLASLPSGQATDCIENGLWLVGGTAKLQGLDVWLANTLGCSVSVVPDPETALLRAETLHATK